jgi:hypothetical protein
MLSTNLQSVAFDHSAILFINNVVSKNNSFINRIKRRINFVLTRGFTRIDSQNKNTLKIESKN